MPPKVSVVLPVYNGAGHLAQTIESLLAQTEPDFEMIVVDDGSTDESPHIIESFRARDSRIRVVAQENGGLTRALIRGCAEAGAALIARQDCGDLSQPDRLGRLVALFSNRPDCVVAAGECEFVGPGGETLYTTTHAKKDIRTSLLRASIDEIVSLPAGAAAVMRAAAYREAGGYRPEFYFAQDVDLWIRMARLGEVCIDPRVLYQVRVDLETISSLYRAEQVELAGVAIALRGAAAEQRESLLRRAALIRPVPRRASSAANANAAYFIASCLFRRHDRRWREYARRALRHHPLHFRSWLLLLRGATG